MINFGTNPYDIGFFALVPLSALLLAGSRHKSFIIVGGILVALAAWALLFAANSWLDTQWIALMDRTPNPSVELETAFNSDGASKTATLLFGLLFSLLYTAACIFTFRMARQFLRSSHRA